MILTFKHFLMWYRTTWFPSYSKNITNQIYWKNKTVLCCDTNKVKVWLTLTCFVPFLCTVSLYHLLDHCSGFLVFVQSHHSNQHHFCSQQDLLTELQTEKNQLINRITVSFFCFSPLLLSFHPLLFDLPSSFSFCISVSSLCLWLDVSSKWMAIPLLMMYLFS